MRSLYPILFAVGVSLAAADTPDLINLSVMTNYTGAGTVTVGFVLEKPTEIMVRAVGPGLSAFGITGLPDPSLTLRKVGSDSASTNDDWSSNPSPAIAWIGAARVSAGAFPLTFPSKDAVIVGKFEAGAYTATVGSGEGTGPVLVEVYRVPSSE